jgi:hypothetical protein
MINASFSWNILPYLEKESFFLSVIEASFDTLDNIPL